MTGQQTAGESRLLRGGNWDNNSSNLASSNRNHNSPTNENHNVRVGHRKGSNPEAGWDKPPDRGDWSGLGWALAGVLVLAIIGTAVLLQKEVGNEGAANAQVADELSVGLEAAEAVAHAFLREPDPAKRLQWVCNADEVKVRLAEYPEEARTAVGEIEKVLGHQMDEGRSVTGFVVAFPSGNLRLLEVVGTPDGPRVDWDAYARYGTASWEELWTGKAQNAVVRVFCEPATERPAPFEDQGKWTCFRMSSPDLPQAAQGFAQVGTMREKMMKSVVLSTPNYRQRFVIEITRHAGKDEPLFEITRCLAVGWVRGERDVEDEWGK